MPDYNRYRVNWTGGPGGEGVSTFYTLAASGPALAAIRDFFLDIATYVSDDIVWDFPAAGDVLDLPSGTLTGGWSETPVAAVPGTNASPWAAGVGFRVVWETGAIVGGRRVRGSTFITGVANSLYDAGGTLSDTQRGLIEGFANDLVTAVDLAIWSRSNNGVSSVSSARVPDRVSWLTSRRQ